MLTLHQNRNMSQSVVLITGATDGIGRALAQIYRARGVRVIGIGRRPAEEVSPDQRGDYCRVDLAQPFASALVADVLRQRGVDRLDRLIHCAGIGSYGAVDDQTLEAIDALLDVNLRAPIALTHTLLPLLIAAHGHVTFIGSIAAALPAPNYAVYGAIKAALEGFARSLREELRGRVGVQIVHPGATRTGMHAKSGMPPNRINERRFPSPMWTAERIVHAIERNAAVTTIGSVNHLLRCVGKHAGGIADAIAARQVVAPRHTIGDPTYPPQKPSSDGRRHCVVTGGANGIGRAVVEWYVRDGWLVTIIDREAPQINRAAQAATTFIQADLAHSEGIDRALRHLAALPAANVVVQSAGINAVGAFAASAIDEQLTVLDVNLRAPLHLTAGLLRFALLAPRATLVFIASLSVYTGYPGAAVYAASKDGLSSYARSLRVALAQRHMNVITVYPGPTRTAHARRYSPDNRRESRRMAPERVAACIAAAVEQRRARVIPGVTNQAVALIGSVAPTLTMYAMRKTIFERLEALSGDMKAGRP